MARVHSSQPFTVEQAQLIGPTGAFPKLDTSVAKAIGGVGDVLQELEERKEGAQDTLAISNANAAIKDAERDYQTAIIGQPLENRVKIRQKFKLRAKSIAGKQRASDETRAFIRNKMDIWSESFDDLSEIDTITAMNRDALIEATDDYVEALVEGSPQDIEETKIPFLKQVNSSFNPAEAERYIKEQEDLAAKQMEDNAIQEQQNLSAINPIGRMGAIQAELESRKKGNKPSIGWAFIDDSTLRSIESYTRTLIGKQKTQSEINMEKSLNDAYTSIRDGGNDIKSLIDINNADPSQSDAEKIEFAERVPTYFNKINSTKIPDQTNEDAYELLTKGTEAVERGAMSPTAFEELFAENVHLLAPDDRRSIRSGDIVATRTMQNRAFADTIAESKAILVQATQDQITAMNTAIKVAELEGNVKAVRIFSAALTLHSAQVWQQSVLRKELRSMMSQNEGWSQENIWTAGEVLTNQLDIPDAELILIYDSGNPQLDVLGKSLVPELDNVWEGISREDRSLILWLKTQGTSDSDILQEIEE